MKEIIREEYPGVVAQVCFCSAFIEIPSLWFEAQICPEEFGSQKEALEAAEKIVKLFKPEAEAEIRVRVDVKWIEVPAKYDDSLMALIADYHPTASFYYTVENGKLKQLRSQEE